MTSTSQCHIKININKNSVLLRLQNVVKFYEALKVLTPFHLSVIVIVIVIDASMIH